MTDNMMIWNAVEATDPSKTKPFSRGGGFQGTATNATWLAKRATEMFGPCGIGWGVKVMDERMFDGAPLSKATTTLAQIHRVHIVLWYMLGEKRGEIEHFGQTVFVGENKYGPFTDDEAPKKSLTDATSKALSMLGFAADIHMGLFDDNKYVNEARAKYAEAGESGDPGVCAYEHRLPAATSQRRDGVDESVQGYIHSALAVIASATDAPSLKEWWLNRRQQDMRAALGIVNGTPEYKALAEAFLKRGNALAAASHIRSAPE